ncbi:MAG: [FeFe] hydrogenase H-cluster radical SAM maturase HydE, partial [Kiritimatiellaeota bacterium]|nr:[FeFe] hydrogenase H-cluster radical SAM maturase HydE [Kiritimatiellota bacterium]
GIRQGNHALQRYWLSDEEIVRCARWAFEARYGSIVLQAGEIESEAHTERIERTLKQIRAFAGDALGITLSLGEQTEETYRRWKAAGADRYLLRIETSSPTLYATLHPPTHSFARRVECLRKLKCLGYHVGTGVLIGLSGQSLADLARDIQFYRECEADMIGMGPFIPHPDTPLGNEELRMKNEELGIDNFALSLRMIALTRLYLHAVNIAATTALEALAPDGRERGLLAGANVIMPNVTDPAYRRRYQLYEGKPSLDETAAASRAALERRIAALGETIAWDSRNDPPKREHGFSNPCLCGRVGG